MSDISIGLVCAACSHDWVANLAEQDNFRLINRGDKQVKIYRVPCPICDTVTLIEVEADGEGPQPNKWWLT